ncbi:MAG: hypothetical protein JWQ48_3311 [Conexibacter sp.]|nr:hypothetical protein [Conexibacter sp.]
MTQSQHIAAAPRSGVCVIGNLLVDLIMRGFDRLPAWGQEVAGRGGHATVSSGQAGYLGLGLGALEIPTRMVGIVGDDDGGRRIVAELAERGVEVDGIEVSVGGQTAMTVAIVREDGERAFLSSFACLEEHDEALVLRHWNEVARSRFLCLVGIFNLPGLDLEAARRLLARARAGGVTTLLDTGWDPDGWPDATVRGVQELLAEVDVFVPNEDEARVLTGIDDVPAAAAALAGHVPGLVVVKRGADGSHARRGPHTWDVPALPVDVQDTVGAGDVYDAGLLYGLMRDWEMPRAMAWASATAAHYVARTTDRFPTAADVDALRTAAAVTPSPNAAQEDHA